MMTINGQMKEMKLRNVYKEHYMTITILRECGKDHELIKLAPNHARPLTKFHLSVCTDAYISTHKRAPRVVSRECC